MSTAITLNHCDPPNRIAESLQDKTIFLTGGTGFIGKVLVEKLLRTSPAVKKIYILIRTKRGNDPQSRLKEIFDGPLYNLLKKTRGEDILKKVIAIPGDVLEEGLGLSPEDRDLITNEVQIIYHLAATVRFDEPFKRAVLINAKGTKLMMELAKQCKRLLVFIHCSTAYCFPHEKILCERPYPPPGDPDLMIHICESLDDETVAAMSKPLMGNCPNAYTFSKALGESIVVREMDNLPVYIVRPSVTIPIWKDPLPGWTDNIFGPTGLLIAAGKGVLRTVYCNPEGFVDFIPVDVVANSLITAFWYSTTNDTRIYNITSTAEVKITWQEIIDISKGIVVEEMPFNWVVWYPGGSLKTSKLLHYISAVLFHYIPAILVDGLIVLTGNKPVLWRVHQKINAGTELLQFYINRKWEFNNDKAQFAREILNETEREVFKFDSVGLDIREYFYHAIHGARLYILKEGDESLPTARRHMKIMWAVDIISKILFLFGFLYLLYKHVILQVLD